VCRRGKGVKEAPGRWPEWRRNGKGQRLTGENAVELRFERGVLEVEGLTNKLRGRAEEIGFEIRETRNGDERMA
jgi:hypothetical protein